MFTTEFKKSQNQEYNKCKYLQVMPRGFANEFIVLRIPSNKIEEAKLQFNNYEDDVEQSGYTRWIENPSNSSHIVDWDDRTWFLFN